VFGLFTLRRLRGLRGGRFALLDPFGRGPRTVAAPIEVPDNSIVSRTGAGVRLRDGSFIVPR